MYRLRLFQFKGQTLCNTSKSLLYDRNICLGGQFVDLETQLQIHSFAT